MKKNDKQSQKRVIGGFQQSRYLNRQGTIALEIVNLKIVKEKWSVIWIFLLLSSQK